jgi:hypothetical protein
MQRRAVQKDIKAPRKPSSPTKGKTKPTPEPFKPITLEDPRAAEIIAAANEYLAPKPKQKRRRDEGRINLSAKEAKELAQEAEQVTMYLGAVQRLAWQLDGGGDQGDAHAAVMALEAISELGSFKADCIVLRLGGMGSSRFYEELDRYARAAGYTKGGAK